MLCRGDNDLLCLCYDLMPFAWKDFNYHVFTQMAALCSKLRHLQDTDVTKFNSVTQEERKKIMIVKG